MNLSAIHKQIPDSKLPYPEDFIGKAKYYAWKVITPCHNFWRDLLLKVGILKHDFRQDYLLGILAPDKKLEDLVEHLKANAWGNHFIAWRDTDAELISVRKLVNFERQYHIRVFNDGEVRGHYEYTPEAHAVWHSKEIGIEPRREFFLDFLGDYIVPVSGAAATESIVREN